MSKKSPLETLLGHVRRGIEDSKNLFFEIIYHRLQEIFLFSHSLQFNAKKHKKTAFFYGMVFVFFDNNAQNKFLY